MYLLSLIIILSYIAGSIPTGLLVSRYFKGVDIRQHGSGNIGSTNVFRTLGWKLGMLVQVGDVLKGLFAVLVIARLHYGDFPFNNRTPSTTSPSCRSSRDLPPCSGIFSRCS